MQVHNQRGMTLVVSLIMLMLITLATVASFRLGRSSFEVVGNMQHQAEVEAAANSTIQEAMSTVRLFGSPGSVFLDPCGAQQNTRCIDTNGDGVQDIIVRLTPTPTCIRVQPILNSSLNMTDPLDAGCALGVGQVFGISGAATGNSLCADSLWEVNAAASDAVTGAQVTITQGADIRVPMDAIALACP